MRVLSYSAEQARALTPLLEAIGREIVERQETVRMLLQAASDELYDPDQLAHELLLQRDALEAAHRELYKLGCALVGRRPLTFSIRRAGRGPSSFLWQAGGELREY